MPYQPEEAVSSAPDLLALVREFVQATKKNSPGGKKITPEEWLSIGEELGVLAVGVVGDAMD